MPWQSCGGGGCEFVKGRGLDGSAKAVMPGQLGDTSARPLQRVGEILIDFE